MNFSAKNNQTNPIRAFVITKATKNRGWDLIILEVHDAQGKQIYADPIKLNKVKQTLIFPKEGAGTYSLTVKTKMKLPMKSAWLFSKQ